MLLLSLTRADKSALARRQPAISRNISQAPEKMARQTIACIQKPTREWQFGYFIRVNVQYKSKTYGHGTQADQDKDDIIKCKQSLTLLPDDKIDENEVRHRLELSGRPIREAIIGLEATGIVGRRPRGGARIASRQWGAGASGADGNGSEPW